MCPRSDKLSAQRGSTRPERLMSVPLSGPAVCRNLSKTSLATVAG